MDVIVKEGRSVDYKGTLYLPGEPIADMEKKEAERLIGKDIVKKADGKKTEDRGQKTEEEAKAKDKDGREKPEDRGRKTEVKK